MPQANTPAKNSVPQPAKAKPNSKQSFVERMANGKPFEWLKVEASQVPQK
ncbi:hypothetical protein K4H28_15700 [Deefgea tanakiae]|uniref:Uncharacterized protein n=1 Tax=Deefgea tanakiae TaxID=2865840 RepID=A0ABX8Z7E4_9NEIS|nr:hypothetical protein [Deefgea tanakiae]QZA77690.1 hypothetical protein K4H28_15700 [Deefgea tanakiae]